MNYLIGGLIFAILFFSYSTIRNLVITIFSNKGNLDGINTYMWFSSVVIINLLIILFIYLFSRYKSKYSLGDQGEKGFPGFVGEPGGDCYIGNC